MACRSSTAKINSLVNIIEREREQNFRNISKDTHALCRIKKIESREIHEYHNCLFPICSNCLTQK